MNILALDTCTEICSAAVYKDGDVTEQQVLTQRGHSQLILNMVEQVMHSAKITLDSIDYIAFGRGPGSFTGVRVCVGVAQGIAFSHQIPVVPVSTLATVAQHAIDKFNVDKIFVAMDARMSEVYAAHYQCVEGIAVLCDKERVCKPNELKLVDSPKWAGVGTGWKAYEELAHSYPCEVLDSAQALLPTASVMTKLAVKQIELGQALKAEQATPVYLRDNVAKKKAEQ